MIIFLLLLFLIGISVIVFIITNNSNITPPFSKKKTSTPSDTFLSLTTNDNITIQSEYGIGGGSYYLYHNDNTFDVIENILSYITTKGTSTYRISETLGGNFSLNKFSASLLTISGGTDTMLNATTLQSMFKGCLNLTSVSLPKATFSNATNISQMFRGCSSLKNLDLSSATFESATDASLMFDGVVLDGSFNLTILTAGYNKLVSLGVTGLDSTNLILV